MATKAKPAAKAKARAKPPAGDELGNPRAVELLYAALEPELGGVEVYRTALECAVDEDLREEWTKYLEQTEEHVRALTEVCRRLGLDPDRETPGRQICRHVGKALVKAMQLALGSATPEAAELVAAECVVHAETKDHMNWSLLGELAKGLPDEAGSVLREACERCEEEEDEHLYHSMGWARELALAALGLEAQLPPPEERQDAKSQMEAAQAKESRR